MEPKVTLKFVGCGGLYHFYVGVCAYLQDNFDINDNCFETSSGSYLAPTIVKKNHLCFNNINYLNYENLIYLINHLYILI